MRTHLWLALVGGAFAVAASAGSLPVHRADAARRAIAYGRKLVLIGGCNDCHTPGWTAHGGHAPKRALLTGDGLVWHGPWGTTYPINLRLLAQSISVGQWLHLVRTTKSRPPMPWWAFRAMSNRGIADIYYYIHSLGPAGKHVSADLPPGILPKPPYMQLVLPDNHVALKH